MIAVFNRATYASGIFVCLTFLIPSFHTNTVHASELAYPKLKASLDLEIEDDWTYQSDDQDAEINDLYPTLILGTRFEISKGLSFNLEATLEPTQDTDNDRAFEDLGGYVNILTANYDTEDYTIYFGKFTPNFGIAWEATPGLFGTDINEDYEHAEMLGAGGSVTLNLAGQQTVSSSLVFTDTSFLSDSAGKSRGPVKRSDGGPANSSDLSSFAIALDGRFDRLEGFRYHVSFTSLEEGDDGTTNQRGYAIAGEYEFSLSEATSLTPIAEYVFIDDLGGIHGDTAYYLTGGIKATYENWFASASYQSRETTLSGGDEDAYIGALTFGFNFDFGLEISAGWAFSDDEGDPSERLGMLIAYSLEF